MTPIVQRQHGGMRPREPFRRPAGIDARQLQGLLRRCTMPPDTSCRRRRTAIDTIAVRQPRCEATREIAIREQLARPPDVQAQYP